MQCAVNVKLIGFSLKIYLFFWGGKKGSDTEMITCDQSTHSSKGDTMIRC